MAFPKFPFVVLDTETTGLTPRVHHIIEFALVRYEGGEKVAEYEALYKVQDDFPEVVQVLTRIQPSDLEGKPSIKDDAEKITKLCEGAVIIGHNVPFDIGMLKGEGIDLETQPWIDSSMLASLVFPEERSFGLGYLSATLNLPHEPMHRAMGDVHATTALFEKICERLGEVPEALAQEIKSLAEKGPEGYATLFSSLESKAKKNPSWFTIKKSKGSNHLEIPSPDSRMWFAVKNLEATLRSTDPKLLKDFTVSHAPQFLLDADAGKALLAQEVFTADEFTLACKLLFFKPKMQSEALVHGGERDVWKGKLASTKDSDRYTSQFKEGNILLDHRQLLELTTRGEGPAEGDHVIFDDASMLEDTATKAFRYACSIDPLRKAAEGNEELNKFLDAYQMWVEKVRNYQDTRYFVAADLQTRFAKDLKERLATLITTDITLQVRERLENLQQILDSTNLEGRIVWISQFRDGGQIIQSVPENVGALLKDLVYDKFKTSLMLPPGDEELFKAIISPGAEVEILTHEFKTKPYLRYTDPEMSFDRMLNFVDGKVVALVTSKRTIEQLYVKHAEILEEQGVTLIAQGMSGGQGRMQAEFVAAEDRAVWIVTPWMYEGVELPADTVDHLWIHTLPFDHPSHAVLSIRAGQYRDAFDEYLVPRLLHRLFRLLRTFSKHRKEDSDVLVLDQRLKTKGYGARIMKYLEKISS
jgi:DNA polymerase III epsilon subunit-like protein